MKWFRTLLIPIGVDRAAMPACVTALSSVVAQALVVSLAGLFCLSPVDAGGQPSGSTTDLGGPECADCEIVAVPLVSLWEPPWFRVWWQPQADAETPPVTAVIALEQVSRHPLGLGGRSGRTVALGDRA